MLLKDIKKCLMLFNVPFGNIKYEINIPEIVENRIVDFINNLPYKKNVVINPFSASEKEIFQKSSYCL
ncbi:hypothetical protein ACMHUM_19735 [Proteus mirabilis]